MQSESWMIQTSQRKMTIAVLRKGEAMMLIDSEKVHGHLIEYAYNHQHEFGFHWGDIIKFTPSQVADILAKMPTIEPPTTTWLGSYTPYTCEHCGFHVDSKTRYCPECGRKASNYE